MKRHLFTLTIDHVGKSWVRIGSHGISLRNLMGRVLPSDVGKRVYRVDGILQVENNEQRDSRLNKESQ